MNEFTVSKPLAPEDIVPASFVTIASEQIAAIPCCFEPEQFASGVLPIRLSRIPDGAGKPLFVLEVCVPFVLVRDEKSRVRLLDTRRVALSKVSVAFARAYLHAHRNKRRKRDAG